MTHRGQDVVQAMREELTDRVVYLSSLLSQVDALMIMGDWAP